MAEVRPIDANALAKSIKDCYCKDCNSYNGVRCRACNFDDAISVIDDALTLGYAPVRHGEWLLCGTFDDFVRCSCCGYSKPLEFKNPNYCPNCGAKMDGGKNDG